jgi:hypothetical protein
MFFSNKKSQEEVRHGKIPADPTLKRLPLLIWGDAFYSGAVPPQVRRVLTGADAHECMYSWVYLNELVTAREMLQASLSCKPSVGGGG